MGNRYRLNQLIEYSWYHKSWLTVVLRPLSVLYSLARRVHKWIQQRYRKSHPIPIIVVGNITVGGTGKSPMVVWLAKFLESQGYRPGIVSRGYHGAKNREPSQVLPGDNPLDVGDEAAMLAQQVDFPVVICRQRNRAIEYLMNHSKCNIIIADDGLQHYALTPSLQIIMVDGVRGFGNHRLLPAGPLREPLSRLKSADFVVYHNCQGHSYCTQVVPGEIMKLSTQERITLAAARQQNWHAVTAIGNPNRFFETLRKLGLSFEPHIFPDHYCFHEADLPSQGHIIMTAKDAVKCKEFSDKAIFYLAMDITPNAAFITDILRKVQTITATA